MLGLDFLLLLLFHLLFHASEYCLFFGNFLSLLFNSCVFFDFFFSSLFLDYFTLLSFSLLQSSIGLIGFGNSFFYDLDLSLPLLVSVFFRIIRMNLTIQSKHISKSFQNWFWQLLSTILEVCLRLVSRCIRDKCCVSTLRSAWFLQEHDIVRFLLTISSAHMYSKLFPKWNYKYEIYQTA